LSKASRHEHPPAAELFTVQALVERHPGLLGHNEVDATVDAVFMTQSGLMVVREPRFLELWLGLTGRNKPRVSAGARR
jgi:hypothetical protein